MKKRLNLFFQYVFYFCLAVVGIENGFHLSPQAEKFSLSCAFVSILIFLCWCVRKIVDYLMKPPSMAQAQFQKQAQAQTNLKLLSMWKYSTISFVSGIIMSGSIHLILRLPYSPIISIMIAVPAGFITSLWFAASENRIPLPIEKFSYVRQYSIFLASVDILFYIFQASLHKFSIIHLLFDLAILSVYVGIGYFCMSEMMMRASLKVSTNN